MADDDLDLELLRTSAREFLASRGEKDSIAELAAMDWTGLLVDEEHSGTGWRPVEACVIAEELGRARDRSPWFGCVMAAAALADAPVSIRDRWLPEVLSGSAIAGFALSDEVVRVIGGNKVQLLVTVDRTGVWLTEIADSGTHQVDDDCLDTERATWCIDTSAVADVSIGSAIRAEMLHSMGRLLVSADAIGAVSSTLERLTAYLKDRVAFGAPIASFQAVQHRLVDLLVFEVRSRAIIARAARLLASANAAADETIAASTVAHAFVTANATAAVDECMQLSGGIGFTWEYPLHHELRRVATDSYVLGTARSSRATFAEVSGW